MPITLRLGLREGTASSTIEHRLLQISDPGSGSYGQVLSSAEVTTLMRPTDLTQRLVRTWLAGHNIHNITSNKPENWLSFTVSFGEAEDLLHTTYYTFRHEDGSIAVRTSEWSLPVLLHDHIDVVQPTTSFYAASAHYQQGSPRREVLQHTQLRRTQHSSLTSEVKRIDDGVITSSACCDTAQSCNVTFRSLNVTYPVSDVAITPECLRCLYGSYNYTPQAIGQNSIGLCNYLNETDHRADIAQFMTTFSSAAISSAYNFETVVVNNGQDSQGPYTPVQFRLGTNLEGNLDAEYILSLSYPTSMTAYNVGGKPPYTPDAYWGDMHSNEPYLDWLDYILTQDRIPLVMSSSYGDFEQTVPESYARKVCTLFAYLGLRGFSMLVASGDNGVGPGAADCVSNVNNTTREFLPSFPATCPWVTAVGATQGFNPEVAT